MSQIRREAKTPVSDPLWTERGLSIGVANETQGYFRDKRFARSLIEDGGKTSESRQKSSEISKWTRQPEPASGRSVSSGH